MAPPRWIGKAPRNFNARGSIPFLWGLVLLHQNQKETRGQTEAGPRPRPGELAHPQADLAIEHPDKFYTGDSPDFGWQAEELAREKNAKKTE